MQADKRHGSLFSYFEITRAFQLLSDSLLYGETGSELLLCTEKCGVGGGGGGGTTRGAYTPS